MMKKLGHIVYLYAGEDTDAPVTEMITCIYKKEQQEFFGNNDWKKEFYKIEWNENLPYWQLMNARATMEIKKRILPKDIICLIGGSCQAPIARGLPDNMTVEFGVGYQGIFSSHRVFESYAWMHHCYGLNKIENGQYYDAVIPNYFDPEDFPKILPKEDYFLYIGRLVQRKGAHIAAEACEIAGKKLIMAGQGVTSNKEDGKSIVSPELSIVGDHVTHIGTVNASQRADLMAKAKAVFVATQYIEPFAGVHIEAMMSGTPVITTDWGVFTETVQNGFNGFRTRSMYEIQEAMKNVEKLDPYKIRKWAIDNYGLDRVAQLYQAYFEQLYQLWENGGWYSDEPLKDYNRYGKIT